VFDNSDDDNAFHLVAGSEGSTTKTAMIDHTNLMVIPQTFTSWAGYENSLGNAYVEMSFKVTDADNNRKLSRCVGYLPLNITGSEFLTGVKHTVTLNLNYLMKDDGSYLLDPGQASGN